MKVLPDTSVWIEYLRRGQGGDASELDTLLTQDEVLVCGPVVAEMLAGAAAADRLTLWSFFQAISWAPLGQAEWRQVGEIATRLRERGMPTPLTDIEIAVSAAAAGVALWTRDADFQRVQRALPELRLYSPR